MTLDSWCVLRRSILAARASVRRVHLVANDSYCVFAAEDAIDSLQAGTRVNVKLFA